MDGEATRELPYSLLCSWQVDVAYGDSCPAGTYELGAFTSDAGSPACNKCNLAAQVYLHGLLSPASSRMLVALLCQRPRTRELRPEHAAYPFRGRCLAADSVLPSTH